MQFDNNFEIENNSKLTPTTQGSLYEYVNYTHRHKYILSVQYRQLHRYVNLTRKIPKNKKKLTVPLSPVIETEIGAGNTQAGHF